ncbi:hypothetical protein ACP70R_011107 [Stipagrostis hirtigluma subsp. patula]
MTPETHPCYDHSYELALRHNLMLLRDVLGVLRFVARVLLDRLGVVSCEGEVLLPGQPWGAEDVDAAAVERFLEAAPWAPGSPAIGTRSPMAPLYRRRKAAASLSAEENGAEEDGDDGESAAVCAICLAGLQGAAGGHRQVVAELRGCSHAFHAACIDAWVSSGEAATCPLCRAPMSPPTAWSGQSWRQSALR